MKREERKEQKEKSRFRDFFFLEKVSHFDRKTLKGVQFER